MTLPDFRSPSWHLVRCLNPVFCLIGYVYTYSFHGPVIVQPWHPCGRSAEAFTNIGSSRPVCRVQPYGTGDVSSQFPNAKIPAGSKSCKYLTSNHYNDDHVVRV
jgi:hypothetical protein